MTDKDPDFLRRLRQAYNQNLPRGVQELSDIDVEELQHLVDEYE